MRDLPRDWRSDDERADDAALTGWWWRCPIHGLVQTVQAVCPEEECVADLLEVCSPRGPTVYDPPEAEEPPQEEEPPVEHAPPAQRPTRRRKRTGRAPRGPGSAIQTAADVRIILGGGAWRCFVCEARAPGRDARVVVSDEGAELPLCDVCATASDDPEIKAAGALALQIGGTECSSKTAKIRRPRRR